MTVATVWICADSAAPHLQDSVESLSSPHQRRLGGAGTEVRTTAIEEVREEAQQVTTPLACVLPNGPRLSSPRVFELGLYAMRAFARPVVVVPGYQLYDERPIPEVPAEDGSTSGPERLAEVDWRARPYDLFGFATFGDENDRGFLCPMLSAACVVCTPGVLVEALETNPRAGTPWSVHLFGALSRHSGNRLVALPGEGAFAWPTGEPPPRVGESPQHDKAEMTRRSMWMAGHREPTLLGVVPGQAQGHLNFASKLARLRADRCRSMGIELWPNG